MTSEATGEVTSPEVEPSGEWWRGAIRLDILQGIIAFGVALELPLNRWLSKIEPSVTGIGTLLGLYRVLTFLGAALYYLVILASLLFLATQACSFSRDRASHRESLLISVVLVGLVGIAASFLLGFAEPWNTLRLLVWLVLAILLLTGGWTRSKSWARRTLLGLVSISYVSFIYYATSFSSSRFLGFDVTALSLPAYRFSELALVGGIVLLPALLWPAFPPFKVRPAIIAVASGVFLGSALNILAISQPASTQLVLQWTSALSFELPLVFYVAAVVALGFTVCALAFDSERRPLSYGLILLAFGGFAPSSFYQYAVTLLGLFLLTQGSAVRPFRGRHRVLGSWRPRDHLGHS